MSLKLYYDLLSQPSRALYILLKYSNYPFENISVNLLKGEHYSDEFEKINNLKLLPVIEHNGFKLRESVAIMRYLARENIIPSSLYPTDSHAQARVDEFLEWQHIGLRLNLSVYFRVKYLNTVIFNKEPNIKVIAKYERYVENALDIFNTKWLGLNNKFITGDNVTVADLLAACEIEQPRMAGFDVESKYNNIAVWIKRVRDHFSPYYQEAHIPLNRVVKEYSAIMQKNNSKL